MTLLTISRLDFGFRWKRPRASRKVRLWEGTIRAKNWRRLLRRGFRIFLNLLNRISKNSGEADFCLRVLCSPEAVQRLRRSATLRKPLFDFPLASLRFLSERTSAARYETLRGRLRM